MNHSLRQIDQLATTLLVLGAGQGVVFVVFFLFPGSTFYLWGEHRVSVGILLFLCVPVLLPLIAGLGLRGRHKWGYWAGRGLFYLLLPGFPLGTYLARRGLSLLQEPDVRRQFGYAD